MTPDRWLVLTVRIPSAELSSELTEGLLALGGTAVEDEGDRLATYVPAPAALESFLDAAAAGLGKVLGTEPVLEWRLQDDEDWAARWKDGLGPRKIGRRITVTQPWNPVPAADAVITVDPGSAFGTGEHATTRGALRLLEAAVRGGERVLDVGAGSGILSIAAILLGAERALGVESDPGAIDSARANLARNGVEDRIELVCAVVDDDYLAAFGEGAFDLVLANLLSGVVVPLVPGLAGVLDPDGGLILGGILDAEAADVVAAAAAAAALPASGGSGGRVVDGSIRPGSRARSMIRPRRSAVGASSDSGSWTRSRTTVWRRSAAGPMAGSGSDSATSGAAWTPAAWRAAV